MALVRAAILAANPHNSQPWRFRASESRLDVFADPARNIGAMDPYRREMYIGIGCAIENLLLAAAANGYVHQLTLVPDRSDPAYAARIDVSPGKPSASELYQAIANRHTNRGAYDKARPVSLETLNGLRALGSDVPDVAVFWFMTDADRRRIGDLTVRATQAIIADKEQSSDSAKWFRPTQQDIQRYRDGITIDASGLPPLIRAIGKILPSSQEQNDGAWLQNTRDVHVATAVAFGIIAARDVDSRAQQLQAGRLWQRMHLSGTTQGLGMQPLNQVPERATREKQLGLEAVFGNALQELIGDSKWQALLLFRVGYPTGEALASPRRAVQDVLS